MVGDILCTWKSGIGCEPLCERSLFKSFIIQQELWVVIFLKVDIMFVFEMGRQAIHRWFLLVHGIFHYVPAKLCRTNVMGTYMIQYLIYILSNSHGGMVITLVYVLVNVLDGLDRGTDFDIDMTVQVIACRQIGIIRDNVTIVKGMTLSVGIGSTIVTAGILRITIITIVGFRTELLWIVLAALAINHASRI